MNGLDFDFINEQREKREMEMRPSLDEIAHRNEATFNSVVETANQLKEISNRLDRHDEEEISKAQTVKRQFYINIAVGVVSAAAAIIGAVFAALSFFF